MAICSRILAQLTAPGQTSAVDKLANVTKHSFQVKVAAIDTNVVIGIQGSNDGTNWAEMTLKNTAVATCAITNNRATITANGTYMLLLDAAVSELRLNFISEDGGDSSATIDTIYLGRG